VAIVAICVRPTHFVALVEKPGRTPGIHGKTHRLDSHRTVGRRHARCRNPNQGRRGDAGTAVWLILFFIACAVVYSVGKLIYQFWT
jgi:hypothetical protein